MDIFSVIIHVRAVVVQEHRIPWLTHKKALTPPLGHNGPYQMGSLAQKRHLFWARLSSRVIPRCCSGHLDVRDKQCRNTPATDMAIHHQMAASGLDCSRGGTFAYPQVLLLVVLSNWPGAMFPGNESITRHISPGSLLDFNITPLSSIIPGQHCYVPLFKLSVPSKTGQATLPRVFCIFV